MKNKSNIQDTAHAQKLKVLVHNIHIVDTISLAIKTSDSREVKITQGNLNLFKHKTIVGLGGLGVTFSPRGSRFIRSNPAEDDIYFFSGRKNPEHKSSGRNIKLGVPSLKFQAL